MNIVNAYGPVGVDMFPLFDGDILLNWDEWVSDKIDSIESYLKDIGLSEESDLEHGGLSVFLKRGDEGTLYVWIDGRDLEPEDPLGDKITFSAAVFATSKEFVDLGFEIETWLKSLE